MKLHRFVQSASAILLVVCVAASLHAQDFLPLKTGNAWCYEVIVPPPLHYVTIRVVGDTVMPNGKQYAHMSSRDLLDAEYIREDSLYVYYYRPSDSTDAAMYNLKAPEGSVDTIGWESGLITSKIASNGELTCFGKLTTIRAYGLGGLIFYDVYLARGFGIVEEVFWGDFIAPPPHIPETWTLVGCIINDSTYGTMVGVPDERTTPEHFALHQNYPNPFNPSTTITYDLPRRMRVTLGVFDLLGREVARLVDGIVDAGRHKADFNAKNLSSGVYIYRLQVEGGTMSSKMTLLR